MSLSAPIRAEASASRPLQVTFTWDDGVADQLQAQQLMEKYGMRGTFYINSANIGLPGFMTRADLDTLKARAMKSADTRSATRIC
jgi:hypothetical protein